MTQEWTLDELWDELRRFEVELKRAELTENTIHTYVERSSRFLRWLAGDYHPRG